MKKKNEGFPAGKQDGRFGTVLRRDCPNLLRGLLSHRAHRKEQAPRDGKSSRR